MFEESLARRNAIVCMDTGAGKTLTALLRIKHELSRSSRQQVQLPPGRCVAVADIKV